MGYYLNDTIGFKGGYTDTINSLEPKPIMNEPHQVLKYGVWAYFLLLIFEGALRKWILPGLATPLLVVRDPVAIWLLVRAFKEGKLPSNPYIGVSLIVGVIGVYTAIFLGHGDFAVAVYGARILLIHFPLMFVIGNVFNQEDVVKIGKVTLWIAIPMAVLIALQFYSPQSAWVNRGVGGDMEGAGFSGALGYSRPPGTFSFTNGLTMFFSFAASFVFYFWLNGKGIRKLVLLAATFAIFMAIPLSISRSLFFSVGVTIIFAGLILFRRPQYLGRIIVAGIGAIVALLILSQAEFFQTSTEVFAARFDSANRIEGGVEGVLLDRYLGGLMGELAGGASGNAPFFGHGIGMGTNVGSMLLSGRTSFLISEGEWGRLIGEMGFMLGFLIILIRIIFSIKISIASFGAMLQGNILPWMLLSFALVVVPQGQWAQPTALGFSTLIGGLVIASFNRPDQTT